MTKLRKVARVSAGDCPRTSKWYETLTFSKLEMLAATDFSADWDLGISHFRKHAGLPYVYSNSWAHGKGGSHVSGKKYKDGWKTVKAALISGSCMSVFCREYLLGTRQSIFREYFLNRTEDGDDGSNM